MTKHLNRRFREVGLKPRNGGPGGWNCPCCGAPRGKRNEIVRQVRRIEKQRIRNMDIDEE